MRKAIVTIIAAVGLGSGLGACGGDDGFDRDGVVADLQEDLGMTRAEAECVVDEAEDAFGVEKLASDDEPTEEEAEQLVEIFSSCTGGD